MKFFASKIIFVLFVSFISNSCFGQKLPEVSKENNANNTEYFFAGNQNVNQEKLGNKKLLLYFTPRIDPVSAFVTLDESGEAQEIRYRTNQLVVTQIFKGTYPQPEAANLLGKFEDSAFRNELERAVPSKTVPEEGDMFHISIEPNGKKFAGLLNKAPETVKNFIQTLLQINKKLTETEIGAAYLRVELIEKERFERLKQKKQLRFITIGELPADLRTTIANVISSSQDFYQLSQGQFDKLETYASYGQELFVISGNSGYQLILYQSQK